MKQFIAVGLILLIAVGLPASQINKGTTFLQNSTYNAVDFNNLIDGATINTTFYTDQTASTSPSSSDVLLMYSITGAGFRKVTLNNLVLGNSALITGQSEVTPAPGDFFLFYDTSGAVLAKASFTNLFQNTNIISDRPLVALPSINAVFPILNNGTNASTTLTGIVAVIGPSFYSNNVFTNLPAFNAPTNLDELLIWDSANGTNKVITLAAFNTNLTAASALNTTDILSGFSYTDGRPAKFTVQQIKTVATNDPFLLRTNMITKFVSAELSITNGANYFNIAHSLGGSPQVVRWVVICKTAEDGYAAGDEISAEALVDSSTARHPDFGGNSTNLFFGFGPSGSCQLGNKTNAAGPVTLSSTGSVLDNFKLKAYAELFNY